MSRVGRIHTREESSRRMSGQKLVSRKAKHYLVRRPNEILWKKLSWDEVQAELREKGRGADEARLLRGAVSRERTERRDIYSASRTWTTAEAEAAASCETPRS